MFLSVRHNRWGIWWRSKEHDDQSLFYCFIFSFSRFFWCCVSFYRSTFWYITNETQRRQAASSARTELSPVFGSIFYVLFCIFFSAPKMQSDAMQSNGEMRKIERYDVVVGIYTWLAMAAFRQCRWTRAPRQENHTIACRLNDAECVHACCCSISCERPNSWR